MALYKHTATSGAVSLLTTELNALAAGSRSNPSTAVDNDNSLKRWLTGVFELAVTFSSSPTAGKTVDLYLLPSVDGINYADGNNSTPPSENCYVGSFAVRAVNTAQRLTISGVALPAVAFKALLVNNSGQNFTASGHLLKVAMSAYEVV